MRILILFSLFFGLEVAAQTNSLQQPNVSANALMLYRSSNFAKEDSSVEARNGLDLQEAEIAFYADVDPYSRLNVLLTVHPEYKYDSSTKVVTQSWLVEPEELYADVTSIPSTTIRLGKFKAAIGKHNLLHSHAYPLTEAPLANTTLLGNEGLNDVGLSAALLLPTPWFSEMTLQYLRGEGENEEFKSPTPGDGVGVAHWKNLWDLNEDLTFEGGLSYAQGSNSLLASTDLAGVDLTFKWRPTQGGKYTSWIGAAEALNRHRHAADESKAENAKGWNIWTQYQFAERWSALLRLEEVQVENPSGSSLFLNERLSRKSGAGWTFKASEFSSYRLEYSETTGLEANPNGETKEKKILLQANFTMGAHPAHSY